jgi:glutathione S-transferase
MNRTLDVLSSWAASGLRPRRGIFALRGGRAPATLLEVYEYEGCPESRRVREALTALDLDAMIYPCPEGGTVYRPRVPEVPYLYDATRDQRVGGARAIVEYLFDQYGGGHGVAPNGRFDGITSRLATRVRGGKGVRARPSRRPEQPLELYSFEASPYSRLARERLCELELPYVLHNVGKGAAADWLLPPLRKRFAPKLPPSTPHRRAFVERAGRVQVPYLVDPNTGVEMFESAAITRYLDETYGG